jgi:hypothetical protein
MEMNSTNRMACLAALMASVALVSGCDTVKHMTGQGSAPAPAPAATAAAPAPAPAPAAKAPAPAPAAAGDTVHVKGLEDWEGDIIGKAAPGSRFTKLTIGMDVKQVTDLIGAPSDQGAHPSGKSFIPFYFGSDRWRHEMSYKGQGRLEFATRWPSDFNSGRLVQITHNAAESGHL